MKAQDRPNASGLEPSCNGSAWESDVSERNSRLTWGEKRGDTYPEVVEFPIIRRPSLKAMGISTADRVSNALTKVMGRKGICGVKNLRASRHYAWKCERTPVGRAATVVIQLIQKDNDERN